MADEIKNKYDIAIIGAGPGGYTAAIRAAQLGRSVVIIEKEEVGGVCLNHGCIPTKALQYSTKLYTKIKKSSYYGINSDNVSIDLGKVIERKDRIVGQLRKGLQYLFKENKIDLVKGEAKLINENTIEVNGSKISALDIILATGSSIPKKPPLPIDENKVFSSDGILKIKTAPSTLAILGAGAIGIEMASIFNEMGSKVSIFEMMPHILPLEDIEISKALSSILSKKGIEINTSSTLINPSHFDAILISVGRSPNIEAFSNLGIKMDKNKVIVNDKMQTSVENIYAIGDIAGRYMLAHTAAYEGIVAASNICGITTKIDYTSTPKCTYSDPGIASVGMTESEANDKYNDVKIGKFPFSASSKSLIDDERDGFIKIITEHSGKILGIHILGAGSTEMIGEAALAINKRLKVEDIIHTIHAHPTIYESMYEAAENVLKQSISIINK